MQFQNGQEMYDVLCNDKDLYNPVTELYVFRYNEQGSIAVYEISNEEAEGLAKNCRENPEISDYWGGWLGAGGDIYDGNAALGFCEDQYDRGEWEYGDASYGERDSSNTMETEAVMAVFQDDMGNRQDVEEAYKAEKEYEL